MDGETFLHAAPWRAFGIAAAAYAMPQPPVTVEQWAAQAGLPDTVARHFRSNGNACLYVAAGRSVGDLACEALAGLIEQAGLDPATVDVLCVTSTMASSVLPPPDSLAGALAHRFGFHRALAFSFGQLNCSSLVGAAKILCRYAAVRPRLRNIVIVTSDIMHGEAYRDRHRTDIQSDGAAAVLIRRDCARNRFGAIEVECLPGYHMGFDRVPHLAVRLRALWPAKIAEMIRRVVAASGHLPESFDALLPLNTNVAMWQPYPALFGRDADFVYTANIAAKAHVCCADAVVNLIDGGWLDPATGRGVVAATLSSTAAFAAFTLHGAPPEPAAYASHAPTLQKELRP